jgi:cellulose synthase/poly-beta-1,6-N-acetylglucosamine synthase-like glycosyltransferase
MISFVIPAHNEEALVGDTLQHLFDAARDAAEQFEVIVVDDASIDRTAAIATSAGARVVAVDLRKISAVRNAGVRVARGEWLVFVDADTLVPVETLRATIGALRAGAVGGGAAVRLDSRAPAWAHPMMMAASWFFRQLGLAAGCFLFTRREDFTAAGGFDEHYFAGEEIHLSRALKKRGRFVILVTPVVTSARKIRLVTIGRWLRLGLRVALRGRRALTTREGLDVWYDGQREEKPGHPPDRP